MKIFENELGKVLEEIVTRWGIPGLVCIIIM